MRWKHSPHIPSSASQHGNPEQNGSISGTSSRHLPVDAQSKLQLVGAAVGTSECHRGPWTRTSDDGSFELCGLREATALQVRVDGRRIQFPEAGVDGLRLQLPPRADDNAEGLQVVDLSPKQRAEARIRRAREPAAGSAPAATAVIRVVDLPSGGAVKIRTRATTADISGQVRSEQRVALPDEECVIYLEADGARRM